MENRDRKNSCNGQAAFRIGSVALIFLAIGYQAALFINRAAVLSIEAHRDRPDTVFIIRTETVRDSDEVRTDDMADTREPPARMDTIRRNAPHGELAQRVRLETRRTENFSFDPNTVSVEDLQRLGFSPRQATAIENYRNKGGRFRRREDFAKSFVVADSVYRRLEPYIHIPKIDINKADSSDFDKLPGIGPYFAAEMVRFRRRLRGYSHTGQLKDIRNFGEERYEGLRDLITCTPAEPYPLWSLPADSLRLHPYIGGIREAEAIVLLREHSPADSLSVSLIRRAGILSPEMSDKLGHCLISPP